jgi:16S rRNA G527 N7-methylase RsmG
MTAENQESSIERVMRWCGLTTSELIGRRLGAFEDWLLKEAIPGGGLGPREADRVAHRHIADAVSFARPLLEVGARNLVDLGAGVGLPGIPLAIVLPDLQVTLIDRGGRRTDLAQRAVHVLGLDNVAVVHGDIRRPIDRFDGATMRAVIAPASAPEIVRPWLAVDGVGVVGLSRGAALPADTPSGPGLDVIAVPANVLDSPGWLLTIRW